MSSSSFIGLPFYHETRFQIKKKGVFMLLVDQRSQFVQFGLVVSVPLKRNMYQDIVMPVVMTMVTKFQRAETQPSIQVSAGAV